MIYKLRRRFILISTVAVLSVVALVFAVILALNISSMNRNMDIFRELADAGKCVILVSHLNDVAEMCDERYELVKISGKRKRK